MALIALGALFLLGGLGGAALAVDSHRAWSENMRLAGADLENIKAANATGDTKRAESSRHWLYLDLSLAAELRDRRNMYGAGGAGGIWMGVALLVLAATRGSATRGKPTSTHTATMPMHAGLGGGRVARIPA
jgi:hypothetical protein